MTQDITCLVTIHGIGFQHAPQKGGQGYADGLHAHLQRHLPALGGDPVSEFGLPAMVGMGIMDLWAAIKPQMQGTGALTPGLQVRSKTAPGRSGVAAQPDPSDSFAVLRTIDQDVTTYICRNDIRERVRSFAHDA